GDTAAGWSRRKKELDMRQPFRTRGLALHGSVALVALVWSSFVGTATAEDTPAVTVPPRASLRRYVDPQPGACVPAPVRPPALQAIPPAVGPSTAGLVERPAPGGGVMLELQGRFLSPVTATAAPDGAPHAECHGPQAATP